MNKKYQEFAERKGFDSWEQALKGAYEYRHEREEVKEELGEASEETIKMEQKYLKQLGELDKVTESYSASITELNRVKKVVGEQQNAIEIQKRTINDLESKLETCSPNIEQMTIGQIIKQIIKIITGK